MAGESSAEASVPISTLLSRLGRLDADALGRLLVGCELDDGEADDLLPIVGFDSASSHLTIDGGRRINLRSVAGGLIVDNRPGSPLLTLVARAQTSAEQREEQVRAELRRRRVEPETLGSTSERSQVLQFLTLIEEGQIPTEAALGAFYDAMKPAASAAKHRRAAEALVQLHATCLRAGEMPSSLPWRLAWFLKESGQLEEAVAATQTPHARGLPEGHLAYLNTVRASALLTLAKIRHDASLLELAEASLKIAYGIDKHRRGNQGAADEVKALYRELDRIREREFGLPP